MGFVQLKTIESYEEWILGENHYQISSILKRENKI